MKRYLFALFLFPISLQAAETAPQRATGPTFSRQALAFSPDAKKLAVAEQDFVKIYETATGKLLETKPACQGETTAVAWAKDGSALAAGGIRDGAKPRGEIFVWRTAKQPLHWLTGAAMVNGLEFSPDSQTLATATAGDLSAATTPGSARLWKVADGTLSHTLGHYSGNASDIAFSPDGGRVAYSWGNGPTNRSETVLYDLGARQVLKKWNDVPVDVMFDGALPLVKGVPLARRVKDGVEMRVEEINGADHMRYRFLVRKPGARRALTDVELGYGASCAVFGGDYLATVMVNNHFPGYESRVDIWKTRGAARPLKVRSVALGSYGLEWEKTGAKN